VEVSQRVIHAFGILYPATLQTRACSPTDFGPQPLKSPGLPGDQLKQVMIFHMLNVVGQPEKTAVDVIESAAIELIA